MQVQTIGRNQVWQSPDGEKKIWEVTLKDKDDRVYGLKTYSSRIADVGFEGDVESYVNNRGGRFVRQIVKAQATPTDTSRDTSIRAQWAIGQAIALASATMDKQKISMSVIEKYAKDLFATVSRVKGEQFTPDMERQAEQYIRAHAQPQGA